MFTKFSGQLLEVPADGGVEPRLIRERETDGRIYGSAAFLPDGLAILARLYQPGNRFGVIGVIDIETGSFTELFPEGTDPIYVATGHVLYARDQALYALPFDASERRVTGDPVPVLRGLHVFEDGAASFSVSNDGMLVYVEAGSVPSDDRSLVWVSRDGSAEPVDDQQRLYFVPRLSWVGDRVAVSAGQFGDQRIWIYDIGTDTWQILTPGDENVGNAVWWPDGSRVAFAVGPLGLASIFSAPADFGGEMEPVVETTGGGVIPTSISPSGELAYYEVVADEGRNILMLDVDADGTSREIVATEYNERNPMVSPDGHWMAYVSDRSGVDEIYVEPFPDGGSSFKASDDGGTEPMWNPAGGELFYRVGTQMIAVSVRTDPDFRVGQRRVLFDVPGYFADGRFFSHYDVDRDGRRFLMVKLADIDSQRAARRINVVVNWFTELKRLTAAGR